MASIFEESARHEVEEAIRPLLRDRRYADALGQVEELRKLTGNDWYVVDEEGHAKWRFATIIAAALVGRLLAARPEPTDDAREALVSKLGSYRDELLEKADEVSEFRASDVMHGPHLLAWVHQELAFIEEAARYDADAARINNE